MLTAIAKLKELSRSQVVLCAKSGNFSEKVQDGDVVTPDY